MALATLLNVNYEETKIEEAGLTLHVSDEKINRLVCEFWRTFHSTYKNCIPSGIIFLPGGKVELNGTLGYGWAPKTWMSAHEVDYPDPLSKWTAETDLLEGEGLLVKYPGFLLRMNSEDMRGRVLGLNTVDDESFTFPVDDSLLEWYTARPADSGHIPFLSGVLKSDKRLAIILSRPQPKASPPEIGLLVEIYRPSVNKVRESEGSGSAQTYRCQIIRRLHVRRETRAMYLTGPGQNGPQLNDPSDQKKHPHWEIITGSAKKETKTAFPSTEPHTTSSNKETEGFCIGETLPPQQAWIVDGYVVNRTEIAKSRNRYQGPPITAIQTQSQQQVAVSDTNDSFPTTQDFDIKLNPSRDSAVTLPSVNRSNTAQVQTEGSWGLSSFRKLFGSVSTQPRSNSPQPGINRSQTLAPGLVGFPDRASQRLPGGPGPSSLRGPGTHGI